MTKSGWNRSKHVEAIGLRSVARRKKERKKEETSKIQDPVGYSDRVIEQFEKFKWSSPITTKIDLKKQHENLYVNNVKDDTQGSDVNKVKWKDLKK